MNIAQITNLLNNIEDHTWEKIYEALFSEYLLALKSKELLTSVELKKPLLEMIKLLKEKLQQYRIPSALTELRMTAFVIGLNIQLDQSISESEVLFLIQLKKIPHCQAECLLAGLFLDKSQYEAILTNYISNSTDLPAPVLLRIWEIGFAYLGQDAFWSKISINILTQLISDFRNPLKTNIACQQLQFLSSKYAMQLREVFTGAIIPCLEEAHHHPLVRCNAFDIIESLSEKERNDVDIDTTRFSFLSEIVDDARYHLYLEISSESPSDKIKKQINDLCKNINNSQYDLYTLQDNAQKLLQLVESDPACFAKENFPSVNVLLMDSNPLINRLAYSILFHLVSNNPTVASLVTNEHIKSLEKGRQVGSLEAVCILHTLSDPQCKEFSKHLTKNLTQIPDDYLDKLLWKLNVNVALTALIDKLYYRITHKNSHVSSNRSTPENDIIKDKIPKEDKLTYFKSVKEYLVNHLQIQDITPETKDNLLILIRSLASTKRHSWSFSNTLWDPPSKTDFEVHFEKYLDSIDHIPPYIFTSDDKTFLLQSPAMRGKNPLESVICNIDTHRSAYPNNLKLISNEDVASKTYSSSSNG